MYDVQDVVKWTGKWARGPLTSCILRASRAHWAHGHVTECQMFAAFALAFRRSWGIGFYWYRSFPDPLLQVLLVPAMFSAARLLLLEGPKMSEHGRKMHKPREPGTVRNRPEPSGTVPDRSWPFLVHGVSNYIPTMLQKLCFMMFWPLLQRARNGWERFRTVPVSHGIQKSLGFTTIYRVFLAHGQCCHIAMTLFSRLGRPKTESNNLCCRFPKHCLSVAPGHGYNMI